LHHRVEKMEGLKIYSLMQVFSFITFRERRARVAFKNFTYFYINKMLLENCCFLTDTFLYIFIYLFQISNNIIVFIQTLIIILVLKFCIKLFLKCGFYCWTCIIQLIQMYNLQKNWVFASYSNFLISVSLHSADYLI